MLQKIRNIITKSICLILILESIFAFAIIVTTSTWVGLIDALLFSTELIAIPFFINLLLNKRDVPHKVAISVVASFIAYEAAIAYTTWLVWLNKDNKFLVGRLIDYVNFSIAGFSIVFAAFYVALMPLRINKANIGVSNIKDRIVKWIIIIFTTKNITGALYVIVTIGLNADILFANLSYIASIIILYLLYIYTVEHSFWFYAILYATCLSFLQDMAWTIGGNKIVINYPLLSYILTMFFIYKKTLIMIAFITTHSRVVRSNCD